MTLSSRRPLSAFRFALLPALAACAVLAPALSHASTGAHYVGLRRQLGCARNVTYAQVQENAGGYAGTVIELRGTVGGVVSGGDTLTVMLNLPSGDAPTLDIPKSEMKVLQNTTTPRIRVLARVAPNSSGNVPVLQVLAVAHDSEVNTEEAKGEARAYADARTRSARAAASRRGSIARGTGLIASRGGFQRSAPWVPSGPSTPETLPNELLKALFPRYADYIAKINPRLSSTQVGQITYHLLNFSWSKGVEPRLVVAMIIAESGFDPFSTSRSGAMGLGQLMPGTARSLGVSNAYDLAQNLDGCISYLQSRLASFGHLGSPADPTDEQISLALAAYNAGMGAVKKYGGVPPYRETQAYVRRILRIYHQLKQG